MAMEPLKRQRLSDQAAQALKRRIVDGTYPSRSQLPTEKELAAELGVTRLTVREALFQLESAGFTRTRHGAGTFVVDLDEVTTFQLLGEMLSAGRVLTPNECESLMEFRGHVILSFADILLERAQPTHIAALRDVITEERTHVGGEPMTLAILDYRFNEVLAAASGNIIYTLLMRSLREMHIRLGTVIFSELKDDALIIDTQAAVVDALEREQPKKLSKVLQTYLDGGSQLVSQWSKRSTR